MKAKIGKTLLTKIPHERGELTFQHPAYRGTAENVSEQIDKAGLKRPTSSETASLVYDAFQNPEGEYESEIIKILKNNLLWEFTGNLCLLKSNDEVNNGVILETNSNFAIGRLNMNKQSLIKRLQENDSLVKFVPFGYKMGEQTPLELVKNPYIIARYGEEGADNIAEVASKYKKNPKLWGFDSVNEGTARMSSLGVNWGLGRLDVGRNWGIYVDGHAFGVCNSEKNE